MQTKSFLPKLISIIAFLAALLVVSSPATALAASQTHNASAQSHAASSAIAPKVAVRPFDASGCYHVVNDFDCTGLDPYGNGGFNNPESPNCVTDSYVVGGSQNIYGSTIYVGFNDGNGPYVRIDLMYSPHCKSNWTQMTCIVCNGFSIGLQTYIVRQAGNGLSAIDWESNGDVGTYENSVMVYAPNNKAQACGMVQLTDGKRHCGNAV